MKTLNSHQKSFPNLNSVSTKIRKNISIILSAGILAITALFLRFWQLASIPFSYYHDEMDYVINGESLVRFGTDLSGNWNPWQLKPIHTLNYTSELAAVFHAAVQDIFGAGIENGHLPAALFGIGAIGMIAYLLWITTKDWRVTLSASIMMALNPWHIYISRLGYEGGISLFFQLLFLVSIWMAAKHSLRKGNIGKTLWIIVLLLGSIFFGAFTYHAAKFTFSALIVTGIIWILTKNTQKMWKILTTLTLLSALTGLISYAEHLNSIGAMGQRQTELVFSAEFLASAVNNTRRLSLDIPMLSLFINKPTVLAEALLKRYAAVFDIYRIFVSGYEGGFQFSLAVHGFFFLSSLPLIVIGARYLWKKHYETAKFVFFFLAVSPVASTIAVSYQSIFRSSLTYTLLAATAGVGVIPFFIWLNKQRYHQILRPMVFLLLLGESVWFGSKYFSQYPIAIADNHYFFEEVLAGYTARAPRPLLIVTSPDAFSRARALVAYQNLMPELTLKERNQFAEPLATTFNLGEITVTSECPNLMNTQGLTQVVDSARFAECGYKSFLATTSAELVVDTTLKIKALASPIDSRSYYYLINDPVCDTSKLKSYVYTNQLKHFNPVKLENDEFCEVWAKIDTVQQ